MATKTAESKPLTPFVLLLAIRDSGCVRNAERQLLDALAMRCRPELRYMAFPSYARLAKDTGLSVKTLRLAAQSLAEANLITRIERPHRSNKFYINVPAIVEKAEGARKQEAQNRHELQTDDCPYGNVAASSDTEGFADDQNSARVEFENSGASWMTGGAA